MKRIDSPSAAPRRMRTLALACALAAAPLAGCLDVGAGEYEYPPAPTPQNFTLQILHAGDMEAGSDAVDDAPRFSAILDALASEYLVNTVIVSSGDNYLPGPFFSSGADESLEDVVGVPAFGRADITMLNAMGFQAAVLGNHEFDAGTGVLADLIQSESVEDTIVNEDGEEEMITRVYEGTRFPYLSVNLDFSEDAALATLVGPDQQFASYGANQLAKSTILRAGGGAEALVGVVGVTTPDLASLSNIGGIIVGPTDEDGNTLNEDLDALAASIQAEVDALSARGINKIILLAHMQNIELEKMLAAKLSDVDVIVAGGSNTLLADGNDRLRDGDVAADTYPLQLDSASGDPVLLVNTEGSYRYVGRLVVTFSPEGVIDEEALDGSINGVYATDQTGVDALSATPNETVTEIADTIKAAIIARDGNTFGNTSVYLNGERGSVRTEETNLGNLTADANLAIGQEVDDTVVVSIKNGGGIRDAIGEVRLPDNVGDEIFKGPPAANPLAEKEAGQVSQLDIENSLRFNNGLTLLTLTAAQLQETIEHAVSASAEDAAPGRFAQIGGMSFSFDVSQEVGKRVVSLTINDGGTDIPVVVDGELQADVGPFRIVTLSFLADGGDGYPFPSFNPDTTTEDETDRLDLEGSADIDADDITFADVGSEQHALAKFLKNNFPDGAPFDVADTPADEDTRIVPVSSGTTGQQ
ncbi:MAG: hypothetical protein Tsb0020_14040 [Haliangiales bacterium]